jgi:hypothetical protein
MGGQWHEWLPGTATTEEDAMTTSMRASLTEIGRQLKAGYRPVLAKPISGKLKKLLARLVALETSK